MNKVTTRAGLLTFALALLVSLVAVPVAASALPAQDPAVLAADHDAVYNWWLSAGGPADVAAFDSHQAAAHIAWAQSGKLTSEPAYGLDGDPETMLECANWWTRIGGDGDYNGDEASQARFYRDYNALDDIWAGLDFPCSTGTLSGWPPFDSLASSEFTWWTGLGGSASGFDAKYTAVHAAYMLLGHGVPPAVTVRDDSAMRGVVSAWWVEIGGDGSFTGTAAEQAQFNADYAVLYRVWKAFGYPEPAPPYTSTGPTVWSEFTPAPGTSVAGGRPIMRVKAQNPAGFMKYPYYSVKVDGLSQTLPAPTVIDATTSVLQYQPRVNWPLAPGAHTVWFSYKDMNGVWSTVSWAFFTTP